MFGVPSRPVARMDVACASLMDEEDRMVELLGTEALRASRSLATRKEGKEILFDTGTRVLEVHSPAVAAFKKWSAFQTKFMGPSVIVQAQYPLYELVSDKGKRSRRGIHVRRLVPFVDRPSHLLH